MRRTLEIRGGRVIDPANRLDAITNVYIVGSKIAGIGTPPEGFKSRDDVQLLTGVTTGADRAAVHQDARPIEAGQGHQGALHRIALDAPPVVTGVQHRVVA